MATLYIDHKSYEVTPGKNLLETCLQLGMDLPYFCWHPALGSVGACRQCAVKIFKDENDKKGRLIMSCMEPVTDKQQISISDPEAIEFRNHVIEWLMTNHPHDCAVCDEGGSCHLQDMTVMTGHTYRKFRYKKRTHKNQYLGPFINHEMNRCIQCYRCVRFYKDYAGGHDLDAFASKNNVYFGRQEDGTLENEFSGNLSEVCPTGVFTDKTLKEHYTRKWDLTMAPSICQHCSLGCNIIAGERYGSLRMIANRYNGEVNGYFICDRGRFGYEFVNASTRIKIPVILNGVSQEININRLFKQIATLKNSNIIGIGSPRASLESNYALKKLVGDSNFYQGVSKKESALSQLTLKILSNSSIKVSSLKEVENADAVFILGEDVTNTAPMLALAVRQAIRQQPLQKVNNAKIPLWNDAAARELIQEDKGPLFIISVSKTKLDEIATSTLQHAPEDIARIGFAVASMIDPRAPFVNNLTIQELEVSKKIAEAIIHAERPVIISGTSSGSEAILKAASNIVTALHKKNKNAGIVLTLPDHNAMGLAILGSQSLDEAFEKNNGTDAVIILEGDLYRHANANSVDQFLSSIKNRIVIDHTKNRTTEKATVLIPTATFAEADGTVVNNEGRAQRFFQVYEPSNGIRESWRWLIQMSEVLLDKSLIWKNQNEIVQSLSTEYEILKGIETVSPSVDLRINGQKIPRQPHRYSGRTSMNADVNVSEPKPPVDPDSPMSYTMEGLRSLPPSSMIPFFWSPGWNSVQATNQYQEEIGGKLKGGESGIRLIHPANQTNHYFTEIPNAFHLDKNKLLLVPLYHIFGSEELSTLSRGVSERSPKPYIAINTKTADSFNKKNTDLWNLKIDDDKIELVVKITDSIPTGVAGIGIGLQGMNYYDLPIWITVNT